MIEIFVFLMQRERTTLKEIAEKFDCSWRTAFRKVEKLSAVIPIATKQGYRGGVWVLPEYKKEFVKRLSRD